MNHTNLRKNKLCDNNKVTKTSFAIKEQSFMKHNRNDLLVTDKIGK